MRLSWRTQYIAQDPQNPPYQFFIELNSDGLFEWYCIAGYGSAIPAIAESKEPFVTLEQAQRDAEAWLYANLGVTQNE